MRTTNKLVLISFCCIIGVVAITTPIIQKVTGQVPSNQSIPPLPHPIPPARDLNKPQQYNDNPTPTLPGNKNLPIDRFLTREQVIGKIPSDTRLISTELKPWGQHEKNVLHGARLHDFSQERMVWEVKVAYSNGISTRAGFFDNAEQIIVIDAQTGRYLSSTTTGDLRPETTHAVQPQNKTSTINKQLFIK